jgi:hypothetical protein
VKCLPKSLKRTEGYSAHGALIDGSQLKTGRGVEDGPSASVRNWLVFLATLFFDTRSPSSTLITKVKKRQGNTKCLDLTPTPLLLDVGMHRRGSGDSDTYISKETNTTGFLLADKESGLRESASLLDNDWLQARAVCASVFVEGLLAGLPEPNR